MALFITLKAQEAYGLCKYLSNECDLTGLKRFRYIFENEFLLQLVGKTVNFFQHQFKCLTCVLFEKFEYLSKKIKFS